MDSIDKEIVFVVKNIAKAVSKHGIKKVVAALDKLNNEEAFIESHQKLIRYIIDEVSKGFKINPEDLKRKNIRGLKVQARSMCFVLLKKHLDLSHKDIVNLFGSNNHSIVSSALRDFDNLNYGIKADRLYLDIFREIDENVSKRKEVLWLKHN